MADQVDSGSGAQSEAAVPVPPVVAPTPAAGIEALIAQQTAMYNLYNDKTYNALSKRINSSMRYEQLVLAPALSYMHDMIAYSEEMMDWLQDEKDPPNFEELGRDAPAAGVDGHRNSQVLADRRLGPRKAEATCLLRIPGAKARNEQRASGRSPSDSPRIFVKVMKVLVECLRARGSAADRREVRKLQNGNEGSDPAGSGAEKEEGPVVAHPGSGTPRAGGGPEAGSIPGEVNWVNPQWSLLDEMAHKLREAACAATVVAPYWPGQMWFQQLESLADEVAFAASEAGTSGTPASGATERCKVQVYLPIDDAWYNGTVGATGEDGLTHVAYDDGDVEDLNMSKER
ncbi:hypothetical protein CYMTET_12947 [Cymbomonas tetramitiformis]|uniref:Uncharacterized protein n=1 Tax=Cymbomonas tetramitiformis TaxID=36881 RepID=A0AAE0GKN8_9CHLO|nr:hypothetical protein CYMTET_12947 [Cymbomonas tetramitiformis]